jgi:hypothetical protein
MSHSVARTSEESFTARRRRADQSTMQVGQFPASAANSLIQGYCDDFVSLAAILAQTLEQVSMRGLNFDGSRPSLQRIENGMRNLAEAIHDLLERGKVSTELSASLDGSKAPAGGAHAAPVGRSGAGASGGASGSGNGNGPSSQPGGAAPAPARSAGEPRAPDARGSAPRPTAPNQGRPSAPPTAAGRPAAPPNARSQSTAVPARGAPGRAAPEGLKGTSQSMPLLSVFQFLGRMRKGGTMRVRIGTEDMTFELQNGCLLASSTSQCPRQELLGELLVELGHCHSDDLDAVSAAAAASSERFGALAIEAGVVTEPQVCKALELQIERRYSRACRSNDARYEFLEGQRSPIETRFRIQPMAVS